MIKTAIGNIIKYLHERDYRSAMAVLEYLFQGIPLWAYAVIFTVLIILLNLWRIK